jgi:hypothetical protein
MRRSIVVLAVLSLLPAAWLIAFLTGYGMSVGRMTETRGSWSAVTCYYLHPTGTYEVTEYTQQPDAVECTRFVSVRSPPPARGPQRWAAALPTDRAVEIECRFFEERSDADGGLGMRFGPNAPLRLAVQFNPQRVDLLDVDDRTALGSPAPAFADPAPRAPGTASSSISVKFEQGSLPVFASPQKARLTLHIFAPDGRAAMFLLPTMTERLLWAREGGCRPRG